MKKKRRRLWSFSKNIGEVPGTLHVDPEAPKPRIQIIAYGPDDFVEKEISELSDIPPLLDKWPVAWVNVDGLGDAQVITKLGEVFQLHPLALEDVMSVPQRPKVEQYDEKLFVVTRMASFTDQLNTEQVSLFLGKNFVLTFQERQGDCFDLVRQRIRKGLGRIRKSPADYLAYALIDATIDAFYPVLERYGEHLQALEDEVVGRPESGIVAQINQAKRDLLALRRAIWPQRESINSLLRGEIELIGEQTRLYLRDCYDHVVQIIDAVETYRELASGLLDAYQSAVSNRMNEVMKVLTIIATIFIPLGFLAGIWGMNFNGEISPLNMPLLNWYFGYPFAVTLMVVIALSMLFFFWRNGWIGSSKPRKGNSQD